MHLNTCKLFHFQWPSQATARTRPRRRRCCPAGAMPGTPETLSHAAKKIDFSSPGKIKNILGTTKGQNLPFYFVILGQITPRTLKSRKFPRFNSMYLQIRSESGARAQRPYREPPPRPLKRRPEHDTRCRRLGPRHSTRRRHLHVRILTIQRGQSITHPDYIPPHYIPKKDGQRHKNSGRATVGEMAHVCWRRRRRRRHRRAQRRPGHSRPSRNTEKTKRGAAHDMHHDRVALTQAIPLSTNI